VALSPLIAMCPALERIDVSFTLLRHIPDLPEVPPLEKLSLTSTYISSSELVELVRRLPKLRVLSIGAMGVKPGTSTSIMNSTAMTLNDEALRELTDALSGCPEIESVNLVQNTKLGLSRRNSALEYFIRRIGRKCKTLNLSGISSLRSADLEGLLSEDGGQASLLQTLVLNKTGINDDAAPWIASCSSLEELEVAETKISADGLFTIIDSCTQLSKLNLTGCRSVDRVDRRRFFEVWREDRDFPP